jgi:hypothetical protein
MFATGAFSIAGAGGATGVGGGGGGAGGTNFTIPPHAGQSVTRPAFSFEYQHRRTFPHVGHFVVKFMNRSTPQNPATPPIPAAGHPQQIAHAIAYRIQPCFILFAPAMRGKSSRFENPNDGR